MKNRILKLIKTKRKGQGDFICSLVALLALTAVLFLSVGLAKNINKITVVDQAARQCVIKLESQGYLDSDTLTNVKQNLESYDLKFDSGHTDGQFGVPDGVYVTYRDSSGNWKVDTAGTYTKTNPVDYGKEIGIYIQCQMKAVNFNNTIFGEAKSDEDWQTISRLKASITKRG